MTANKDQRLYEREQTDIWNVIKKKGRKFDRRTITKRIPSVRWLPRYQREFIPYDFIAGLTVALTAIPQGIAYAVLAGLPPQYGLYSEIMPGIMYMIFGSTSYITIGPTAIMALMIQPYVKLNPAFALFGSFLTGAIILLLGVLNLGMKRTKFNRELVIPTLRNACHCRIHCGLHFNASHRRIHGGCCDHHWE